MDRSQLRRLAEDHAKGHLGEEDYQRQRGELIDAIVGGQIAIEREPAPPPSIPGVHRDTPPAPSTAGPAIPKFAYALGAAVVIVLAVWAFLPAGAPPQPELAQDGSGPQQEQPAQEQTAAKVLVDAFLKNEDWTEDSLTLFEMHWAQLTEVERTEAQMTPGFLRMSAALNEELNVQRALAELDTTGRAAKAGARLEAFGRFVGLRGTPPESRAQTQSTPLGNTSSGDNSDVQTAKSQSLSADPKVASAVAPSPRRVAPRIEDLPGNSWVQAHEPSKFTLQLFAVNGLDKVEQLISAYPELHLKILSLESKAPRYRVLYGVFNTTEEAENAIETLPLGIRQEGEKPLIKTIEELRNEVLGRSDDSRRSIAARRSDVSDLQRRLVWQVS